MSRFRSSRASSAIARGEEAAHVHDGVLLGAHRRALGQRAHLADDLAHALLGVSGLAELDEVGVLGQAAGVEVERRVVLGADRGHLAHVGKRDRLPAAGVVGDGEHDERDAVGAVLGERLTEAVDVHVALEGVVRVHVGELGRGEVERDGSAELDVGARRVEVAVVGHHVALVAHDGEEDPLGSSALMGRDDVLEAGDVLDRVAEAEPAGASRIRLVAAHDAAPLLGAHCAGAGVGEEVDDHVFGAQLEDVVAGLGDHLLSLLACGHLDLLDHFDAERLDDRLEHGASRCHCAPPDLRGVREPR